MKKIILILSIILFMVSCSNSDNDTQSSVSPFKGTWTGTYTGTGGTNNTGDNGTASITVLDNGSITGTATSIPYNETYQLTGTVNNLGNVSTTFGNTSAGGVFNGNMSINGTAAGTWSNNIPTIPFTGNWNTTKQ